MGFLQYLRTLKARTYQADKSVAVSIPHWHHDFLDRKVNYIKIGDKTHRIYRQPYKGIWIVFWVAPTPEDIKLAQADFDHLYPNCEDCNRSLFVCTCMVALEGFA